MQSMLHVVTDIGVLPFLREQTREQMRRQMYRLDSDSGMPEE